MYVCVCVCGWFNTHVDTTEERSEAMASNPSFSATAALSASSSSSFSRRFLSATWLGCKIQRAAHRDKSRKWKISKQKLNL